MASALAETAHHADTDSRMNEAATTHAVSTVSAEYDSECPIDGACAMMRNDRGDGDVPAVYRIRTCTPWALALVCICLAEHSKEFLLFIAKQTNEVERWENSNVPPPVRWEETCVRAVVHRIQDSTVPSSVLCAGIHAAFDTFGPGMFDVAVDGKSVSARFPLGMPCCTLLTAAAMYGDAEVCSTCLELGADVN